MASSSRREQSTNIKQALYNALMKEEWQEVVTIFEGYPEIHGTKIADMVPKKEKPDTNDDQYEFHTALHWAITQKADELSVAKLVFAIKKAHSSDNNMTSQILKSKNKRGDTPLHCAASRGSTLICIAIVENDESLPDRSLADLSYKSLVDEHNDDGETPLFLAAHNGHESAFFYLHLICKSQNSKLPVSIWQRNKGDTMLHCTIRKNYFGEYTLS